MRVSDKTHYVSPSRGQLGNALKCVWAAPFVVSGQQGRVDVAAGGVRHRIDVTLDRIAQRPQIARTETASDVKNGTIVTMYWPQIARYLDPTGQPTFYNPPDLWSVLNGYAAFNPHATFSIEAEHYTAVTWNHTAPDWSKWLPTAPTSPHWYTVERLRALIAAYIAAEQDGDRPRTVREFVAEFAGLSGTAKQKAVTEAAGLSGAYLRDLVSGGDVHAGAVDALLAAMKDAARKIKPLALGALGEAHLSAHLVSHRFAQPGIVRYKKIDGDYNGLPFVVEVACGILRREYQGCGRDLVIGLNWSPALTRAPIRQLSEILGEQRVDSGDPVVVLIHLACPRLEFTDRGKSVLSLPMPILDALGRAVRDVTNFWKKAKRQADQQDRVRERDLAELRKEQKRRELNIKEAAYLVMERAYMQVSDGRLPANARQIMYAARKAVLELTGGKCWKNSSYFTQHLLTDFMDEHPELTANWDVVFDARGKLMEPHTGHRVDLGSLAVRRYIQEWHSTIRESLQFTELSSDVKTAGPANRYRFALFIEKEGFSELIDASRIAERYDIAIMSTKGMSVTAARQLVERLSQKDVTVLVLRDFDKAGFSIQHTLQNDTRRYTFTTRPRVIDLGLRLQDVQEMGLTSEPVEYRGDADPRENLRASGATEDECRFLVHRREYGRPWVGERVELNAMTSAQFIAFVERKLDEVGVTKYIPDQDALARAYRRAHRIALLNKAIAEAANALPDDDAIVIPADVRRRIDKALDPDFAGDEAVSWDAAIAQIAQDDIECEEK